MRVAWALLSLLPALVLAKVDGLWPQPHTVQFDRSDSAELLKLTRSGFSFKYSGQPSKVIDSAIQRFPNYLFPRTPSRDAKDPSWSEKESFLKDLDIQVVDASGILNHATDESYNLSVSVKNGAVLIAQTAFGVLRGLETFSQLMDFSHFDSSHNAIFLIENLPIEIYDVPRFSYRGLMIDTARHYLPLNLILDNLDVMAFNKLNVLHWHMTDSQSFPYKGVKFPDLANKGAYQYDHIYTIDEVKKVVSEAYLRGIRVIPEFDSPGHTKSWGEAMPQILSHCPNPSEPLDPSNPLTFSVLTELYEEIISVFGDEYVHLGGDEVDFTCWSRDPNIASLMKAKNISDYAGVENYFESKLLDIVGVRLNKKTIVWQEIFDNGLHIRPDTVVDVWKGYDQNAILRITAAGYQVVISGCWYLDHIGDDWNAFYQWDLRNFPGSDAQKALLIGGHSSMWGEHVDASNFMSRVWPRASAVAEKLWIHESLTPDQAYPRLEDFRCRMVARNIPADTINPGYCPVELEYDQGIEAPQIEIK